MAIDHTLQRDLIPRSDISLQASNVDALMIGVSVTPSSYPRRVADHAGSCRSRPIRTASASRLGW